MIKNILFDMGGVIFNQTTEKAFKLFREAGIDTDKYMGHHGQREFFLDLEMGRIDKAAFCREMSKAAGHSVDEKTAAKCWQGFFGGVPIERLVALKQLREKYHLGLLSNTNPFMMELTDSDKFSTEGKPISYYFDSMFLSYELKAYKPDSEIFIKSLEQDNLIPEETLFVDDSLSNIEGAKAVGLKTLHVPTNEDWVSKLNDFLAEDNRRG